MGTDWDYTQGALTPLKLLRWWVDIVVFFAFFAACVAGFVLPLILGAMVHPAFWTLSVIAVPGTVMAIAWLLSKGE